MREIIRAPGHSRNRSLGWLAVEWIEQFCIHGPGDVQGEKVKLDDELTEFIVDCYAHDKVGRRFYDSAFLSRAKGRAKSELAAFIVLFEAMGPCRFAGWAKGGEQHTYHGWSSKPAEPGDPLGRLIVAPFIRCLATEESQAGNTYDNVYFNLSEGPLSEGLPRDAAGLTRTYLPGGGEIRPSTSGNASKDGGRETFVVVDETHLYVLPELKRMYATVRRNLAKRKAASPWSLETSTMYLTGEESVAEETHKFAQLIKEGKTRQARLLFDHREADGDVDLSDEEQVHKALTEVYGPFAEVMDLQRIIDEILDPRNSPADSRRYFLNQKTAASDAWVAEHEWVARADATKVVADRTMITLGFDGSRKRAEGITDATALIGVRVTDGHVFELATWEQPQGPAGREWRVSAAEVHAAVETAFNRYNVVGFYCDPAKWETSVAQWQATYGKRLRAKVTQAAPCEFWMTGGRSAAIVRATEQFHSAVMDGGMTHDGSSVLTRHVLNARRRSTRSGLQISKESPDSPRKIDAAVAAILAWQARLDAIAAGVIVKRGGFAPRRIH